MRRGRSKVARRRANSEEEEERVCDCVFYDNIERAQDLSPGPDMRWHPPAHSVVIGPAVINKQNIRKTAKGRKMHEVRKIAPHAAPRPGIRPTRRHLHSTLSLTNVHWPVPGGPGFWRSPSFTQIFLLEAMAWRGLPVGGGGPCGSRVRASSVSEPNPSTR